MLKVLQAIFTVLMIICYAMDLIKLSKGEKDEAIRWFLIGILFYTFSNLCFTISLFIK